MANLEMCVREEWRGDISRLAWRRAGTGPTHSGNRVRPPLPILMSRGGSAAGPPGGGTQSGSVGQQGEGADVCHSANHGGRWSNNVVGFFFFCLFS